MKKILLSLIVFAPGYFYAQSMKEMTTEDVRKDLRNLIAINSDGSPGATTFNNSEGRRLEELATASQIAEVVPQFLAENDEYAKHVCWGIIGRALTQKPNDQVTRRKLVDILCEHYLSTDSDIQGVDNIFVQVHQTDFTEHAKELIRQIFNNKTLVSFVEASKIAAVAQIEDLIPIIWKKVDFKKDDYGRYEMDILASLARMGQNTAAELLCNRYLIKKKLPNPLGAITFYYVIFSKNMAFSLHPVVLKCLIEDLNLIDLKFTDNGRDYYWSPAGFLALSILSMLKEGKNYEQAELTEILSWLNSNPNPELATK